MYGIEKFVGFPAMNFGRTLVVSFQLLSLVLGGSRLWEKQEGLKLIGRKRNRHSIRVKIDFYEVCISYFIY